VADYSGDQRKYTPDRPEQIVQLDETPDSSAAPSKGYSTDAKLTPSEVKVCKRRMDVAEKYYENVFRPWYDECQKLLNGEHYVDNEDHQVVINIYPHVVETQTHAVTFNHPEHIIQAEDPIGQQNVEMAEKVVKYDYRKSHAHREARRAFKESRMYNFGVVMDGWAFETDEACYYDERLPVEGEMPDPDEVLEAVASGKPPPPPIPKAKVRRDEVYVRRIDPCSWRVSPESTWVIDDMQYCGYVEYCEVSEVKANPRYKNTRQLKGSTKNLEGYFDQKKDSQGKDIPVPDDLKRVKLIHYYEKRRKLHLVFCDEHDQALCVQKWSWQHDRYPFRLVFTEPGEAQFYVIPPMLQIKHMQQELNHFHTMLAIHIRRFNRHYVARAGAFTEANKKKLKSGVDGTIVETQDNPSGALVPVIDAQISPDVYNYEQKVMSYLSLLSGIDQYEMGRAPTKRMTQEEVGQVAGAGGARAKRAAAAFEELCAGIAEDIISWNQQFAVRARKLPVVQGDQIVDWQNWTMDEIQGEFAFEVYVGSTEIKNKQGQVEQLGFLLQALQPYVQMVDPATGQPELNMKPMFRQLLALIPELKDVTAIVGPDQPAPVSPAGPGALPGGGGDQSAMAMLAAQGGPPQPMLGPGGMEPPMGIPPGM
jgi:hypothetical protein